MDLSAAAQKFVSSVAFGSPTLYSIDGQAANWYWYGYGSGSPEPPQLTLTYPAKPASPTKCNSQPNPPSPLTLPSGPGRIGWGTDQVPLAGYPLAGGVSSPDGEQFLSITDCSGFASFIVEAADSAAFLDYIDYVNALRAAVTDLQQLDRLHTQPWPSAADFAYGGFQGAPDPPALPASWLAVATTDSLLTALTSQTVAPGDILAWALSDDGSSSAPTDTGHVMIIDQVTASGAQGWKVSVYDASCIQHEDDSRQGNTGVGLGTITLQYVSGSGWQFNFNEPLDSWHDVNVLSVLRLAG